MNTRNVLMLVVLSAGMLTALTASAMSQGQTAFADDKKKCEDNGGNDCNDTSQDIKQKNDCKVDNEIKDDSDDDTSASQQTCSNTGLNPDGDLNIQGNSGSNNFGVNN